MLPTMTMESKYIRVCIICSEKMIRFYDIPILFILGILQKTYNI